MTNDWTVKVTLDEIFTVAVSGVFRRVQKLDGKRRDREQAGPSSWDNEVEGAIAEFAWSKLKQKPWTGMSGVKAPDGADGVEIRWTHHEDGGLIIYPDRDSDDSWFVLAKGNTYSGEFRFVGWLKGSDAKRLAHRRSWGWLVSPDLLNDMPPREGKPQE